MDSSHTLDSLRYINFNNQHIIKRRKGFNSNESDEMNPNQWIYSEVHNEFRHLYTAKTFKPSTFYMWFPNYDEKEKCVHEWKGQLLLTSTVYNCSKCGKAKEEFDDQKKQRLSAERR